MPLSRYQIRNEYSLADPELYRSADKDDPEALLEGVSMAGLVGVLRQLGDLAEFAAEIFHDLHEEVMATAARGHGLMSRVQQLEAEFPSIEKAILSQTNHSSFFYNAGVDWHPNLHMDQNLITRGDLPRFVMDSYEECRGPPRLFLLDKFDVAGAGACLKRYTDPSFFKVEPSSSGMTNADIPRDKKTRKAKKKGSRWKNAETPEVLPTSHAKLHELFLEERVQNGIGDTTRRVKLKRSLNGFPFNRKSGKSYMDKFLKTPSPEHKEVHEITVSSSPLDLPPNFIRDSGLEVVEISTVSPNTESVQRTRSQRSSSGIRGTVLKPSMPEVSENVTDGVIVTVPELSPHFETDNISRSLHRLLDEKEIVVDGKCKVDGSLDGYQSDDIGSEIDSYMDALATMESEMETDCELRGKSDLGFLNSEMQGIDSDANDDQLQANFSDSQSTGNSTVSDDWNVSSKKGISSFSYSDTPRTSTENTLFDKDVSAKVFPSTEICEPEIIGNSSSQLSVNVEVPVTQPPELVVSGGASVEVGEVPSGRTDIREPSSSSCLSDLVPKHLPMDPGALLMEGTSVEPELDEISSKINRLGTQFSEENVAILSDNLSCASSFSDVIPQTMDDFLPTLSTENRSMHELDDEDSNVFRDASIQFSNILEGTSENKSSENPLDDVPQTESGETDCAKNLIINSPHSFISHTEESSFGPAFPEAQDCNPSAKPDGIVSELDTVPSDGEVAVVSDSGSIPSVGEIVLNLNPVVDSPNASDFGEQQVSQKIVHVPSINLDSEEVGVSYSGERTLDGDLSTADGEEMGRFPKMDLIGNDGATREFSSDLSNNPGPASLTKLHLHLNQEETEAAQSEPVLLSAAIASPDNDANDDSVVSPSTDLKNLQEESHFSSGDLYWTELETNTVRLSKNCGESNKQGELNQPAVASPDLNSILCSTVSSDHSESELRSSAPGYSLAVEAENNLHLDDSAIVPSYTEHRASDSDSESAQQYDFVEKMADTSSSILNQQVIASPVSDSNLHITVSCDRSDLEFLNSVPDSSLAVKSKNYLHLDNATSVSATSEHSGQDSDSKSLQQSNLIGKTDLSSLHIPHFADLRTPLEQNVELQTDQLNVDLLHATEASVESSSQLEHIQLPNDMENKRQFDAFSESSPVDLPSQPSMLDLFPQPEQAMDPAGLIFPGFGRLPETSPINLEEMPPLPPLPPVQWRIGKLQHASPALVNNAAQHNVDSFPPLVPSTAEERAHSCYPAHWEMQRSNPFLPLSATTDENSQHVYERTAGSMAHSGQLSLDTPMVVKQGNSWDDSLISGTQSVNPLLILPARFGETPQHSFHAGEGGIVQPNVNLFSTVTATGDAASAHAFASLHENPFQLHQVASETSLGDEKLEPSSGISEGNVVNPCIIIVSPPTKEHGQPQNVLPTPESEITCSSAEDENPSGNCPTKLPRPRNPLIDAVAAHDKSKLRKVTERVHPQINQVEERDSLLEQIRTKSFNLKPAAATRPSIKGGPKTNLRVAAILEKANAIRQAWAGSDEDDDDGDSWSDS